MKILDEILEQLMKAVNHKLYEIIEPFIEKSQQRKVHHIIKCNKCKYNREYARKCEKKYKSLRESCYCLLGKKMEQIRTLETENAALKNIKEKEKSVFINEISIFCRDILFD